MLCILKAPTKHIFFLFIMHLVNYSFYQCYNKRPIYIPKRKSPEIPDVASPDSEEEISSTEQKMETMCNQYFGITRQEYFALEEEAVKKLSGEHPGYIEKVMEESKTPSVIHQREPKSIPDELFSERRVRIAHGLEEQDDKIDKKPKKGWKKWKSRIVKLFKPGKGAKSK